MCLQKQLIVCWGLRKLQWFSKFKFEISHYATGKTMNVAALKMVSKFWVFGSLQDKTALDKCKFVLVIGGLEDIAWSYTDPLPEIVGVERLDMGCPALKKLQQVRCYLNLPNVDIWENQLICWKRYPQIYLITISCTLIN